MYIFIIGWSRTQLATRYDPKPTMKKKSFITSFRIADVLCKGAFGEQTREHLQTLKTIADYVLQWRLVQPKSFITRYVHTR